MMNSGFPRVIIIGLAILGIIGIALPTSTAAAMTRSESTFGQLVKRAQSVVVGNMSAVTTNETGVILIHLRDCSSIHGAPVPADATFELGPARLLGRMPLPIGQPIVAFASSLEFNWENFESFRFDYRESFPERAPQFILAGARGLTHGNRSAIDQTLTVIRQYWNHLREEPRDALSYAAFLITLLAEDSSEPPVDPHDDRIRFDARSDLRFLIRYAEIDQIRLILNLEPMEAGTRAYAERILQWKIDGEPTPDHRHQPSDENFRRSLLLLKTGSRSQKLGVLADLMSPRRMEWALRHADIWLATVVRLLESPEEDVRLWSAVLLSHLNDRRCIPPLTEALQSKIGYRRKAAWEALERVSNGAVPSFDPDGPPNERREAIKRIMTWLKTNAQT
jgi:hypothetical protein